MYFQVVYNYTNKSIKRLINVCHQIYTCILIFYRNYNKFLPETYYYIRKYLKEKIMNTKKKFQTNLRQSLNYF